MTTFTASEVRESAIAIGLIDMPDTARMLHAFADRLEADEKGVPVAWRTFDGEGSYDYRDYENNEHYRDWYVSRNGAKYANWVEPLYSHPAPSDAERLADETALRHGWAYSYSGSNLYGDDGELQDNAAFPHIDWLRDSVQELHQKVAKRGAAKLATRSAQAQPPAARVPDGFLRHVAAVCMGAVENCRPKASLIPEDPQEHNGGLCLNELTHIAGEIDRMLAAQENPNG